MYLRIIYIIKHDYVFGTESSSSEFSTTARRKATIQNFRDRKDLRGYSLIDKDTDA